jgi:hypothetical protein
MTGTRTRITRLVVAVVFALPIVLSALSLSSLAAPSAEEVQAANEKLAQLEHEFEVLAERYNDAKYRLSLIERKLSEARSQRDAADRKARVAEERLADRAAEHLLLVLGVADQVAGGGRIAEELRKVLTNRNRARGFPAGPGGLWHRWFQGYGYPAFTGGLNTTFASDGAVEGWNWLADIWEHTNPQSTTYGFMQEPLLSGEVLVAWDHTARLIGALDERPDDFVAFPSPTGPEGLAFMPVVGGLGIPATSPDPDGAMELIEYLTRPEVAALTLRETAFFPGTGDELPADLEGGVAALAETVAAQQQSPEALPSLLPIGLGDQGGAYNKVFQDSFRAIVLQGGDPASVLDAEAGNLQSVLDTAGADCWFPDPESGDVCPVG